MYVNQVGTMASNPKAPFMNRDLCYLCKIGGTLYLCDFCPLSFHTECIQKLSKRLKREREDITEENWMCPECLQNQTKPKIDIKDAKLFEVALTSPHKTLGKEVSLARLMQHLELMVPSIDIFGLAVKLCVEHRKTLYRASKAERAISLEVAIFMKKLGVIVGDKILEEAILCCEAGGYVAYGLGTMGGTQQCYNPTCSEYTRFRVLRTFCLICGSPALDEETRLPPIDFKSMLFFATISHQLRPKMLELKRLQAAQRGLEYFSSVALDPKVTRKSNGDLLFLAYKLWGSLKGTELEVKARIVTEKLSNIFIQNKSSALAEDIEMADILDLAEGKIFKKKFKNDN